MKPNILALIFLIFFITSASSLAKSCKDFKTHQDAQKFYENRKKLGLPGWKKLDRDGDGEACDCLPAGNGRNCPKKRLK